MHSPFPPPIPPDMLLLAYQSGIFPMADRRDDPDVFWVEPRERAIVPLETFRMSKSLRKTVRQDRFAVTLNRDFSAVMQACAAPRPGHPESWISERIIASYKELHAHGSAHSIECWITPEQEDGSAPVLAGGLYGVSFDRVFCGESMFSRADNASKVALTWLVALLRHAGYELLDCQFMTDHLASLGAVEMPQADYLELVQKAREAPPRLSLNQAFREFADPGAHSPGHSSPGKAIAQSLTQTS